MTRIGGALLVALALGCEDVSSSEVRTSGIWAGLSVDADGRGGSIARAALKVGGELSNTYVELDADDALTATLAADTVPMVEESLGTVHHYVATFATDPVGEPFTIAFERTIDESAPSSGVALPPAFDLASPVVTFSRLAEDLTVSWSPPSAEPIRVEINGGCIQFWGVDLASDGGSTVVPAGTLAPANDVAPEACDLDVIVTRTLAGEVDPAYGEGGRAEGRQVRSYHVSSTP